MFKMIGSEVFIPIQVARMGKSMLRGEESNQTLFRVVDQKPFSVTLQFDFPPNRSDADTTIELQYKRVPYKDNAHPDSILDNPVIESFTVDKSIDSYNFTIMDVPKGKYIICAMNLTSDVMFEPDPNTTFECIEVFIKKYGGHSKCNYLKSTRYIIIDKGLHSEYLINSVQS